MSLFMCRNCGCVDNTAMGNYWWTVHSEHKPPLCTECDPEIGKWHGQFPKRSAAGMFVDQDGHLWHGHEDLPIGYELLGVVSPNVQVEGPPSGGPDQTQS
jgi:hypothetical protein